MARTVEISESNFKRIQDISEPLVDTVDSVLQRLLDAYQRDSHPQSFGKEVTRSSRLLAAYLDREEIDEAKSDPIKREYDPFDPPDLTHTGISAAKFGGETISSPNWNSLLDTAIRFAIGKLGGVEPLRKVVSINVAEGRKTDQGYRYLADVNVSVQGQSAKDAWRATARIARRLGHVVHVAFYWQNKQGAEHPGEVGIFRIVGMEL
ncbi:MAG: hypothetical protein KGJ79_16325 [Alphaproteobacteria bacterium]|nr:hypothetical protein [Alphaproteobacteria bacterium]MDE2112708.1 hypothetical protein [Alphaproteobacteria bacterium]MDE2495258.1 hypothetical protein [Alphaproteobacteria bacterium]